MKINEVCRYELFAHLVFVLKRTWVKLSNGKIASA